MFTWFQRGSEYLGYEARRSSPGVFVLVVRDHDGSERTEQFADQDALLERQMTLQRELEAEGWTGPHGWNL